MVLGDVGDRFVATSQMLLQQQVVSCRDGVVSIVLDVALRLALVARLVVVDQRDHVGVDRDWVLADVDTAVLSHLYLLVPRVSAYSRDGQSVIWVRRKNLPDKLLA